MTREELYSEIVGELIEQGYSEYRERNEEIAKLYKRLSEVSDILDTVKKRGCRQKNMHGLLNIGN